MKQFFALAGALILFLTGCCRDEQSGKLVIISTNDIHSSIDNFPALATLAESYRSEEGVGVLLVDAGDRWTGSPYVDMAPEQYKPVIDLMNAVGYDVATLGNHEWDSGNNLLAKRIAEAGWTSILGNASVEGTALDFIEPYHIRSVDGLKIAFTGLVTTAVGGRPDGKPENFGGVGFHDPYVAADRYASLADSADLYIVLSHLGFRDDSLLALQRPEIDLIIGGHSHTVIPEGMDIAGTVVTQTGKNLVYAGVTEITHKGGKVTGIDNRLVMLDTVARDPAIQRMVDAVKNEPELMRVVGSVTTNMDKIALMNLFSDAMRTAVGADYAFHNMGGMRIDRLAEGEVLKADVYSAEPFGNTIVTVTMTMNELAQLILSKFNSTGKESHTLDLYPSGLEYVIYTDGEGRGTDVFFESSPRDDATVTVALSDYVATVYDYSSRGPAVDSGIRIAAAAEAYIGNNSPIEPDPVGRVVIE